ncbi:MAG: hypothetical protein ACI97B_003499 [Verrucomicrobiales bacterium]|jgi:hypothetical protein
MESSEKIPWKHLALCLTTGVIFRIVAAFLTFRGNFDSTTVGLMALDILKGARPLFFYGQNYMGALEAYGAAFFVQLFGANLTALALSPIAFTAGWILFTYFLFRDLIHPRAGLAAAWVIAIPGWTVTWYTINTYGGYPACFMFGTLCAWLAVRLDHFKMRYSKQLMHILLLGLAAGLALWTNFQSGVYLAFCLVFLVRFMHREKWALRYWLAAVAGGVAFIVGVLPVILEWHTTTGAHVAEMKITGELIASNFAGLTERHLGQLAFGVGSYHPVYIVLRIVVWGVAFLTAGYSIFKSGRFWPVLAPLVFLIIFLALYLPHPLASEGATRYLITFWTMLTLLLLAVPMMNLAFARYVLLAWLALNVTECAVAWQGGRVLKRDALKERRVVVQAAHAIGAKTVNMAGGYIFGHYGQTYGWSATNRIDFVSTYDERRQDKAQSAELAQPQVFASAAGDRDRMRQTLHAIGVSSQRTEASAVCFFRDLRITAPEYVHVPFTAQTAAGEALVVLNDRQYASEQTGQAGEHFILALEEEIVPGRIWLLGKGPYQHTLPDSIAIYTSTNQVDWQLLYETDARFNVAYTIENQVYVKGFFGVMECVPPTMQKATHLKFVCREGAEADGSWGISEVFVHAYAGRMRPTSDEEIATINTWMRSDHIEFLTADRWLSARLFGNGVYDVYPRFNSKFRATQVSRMLRPRPGLALAVRSGMEAETQRMFHPQEIREIRRTKHYSVFFFNTVEADAMRIWNGHAVLRNTGPEPPWF